MSQKFNVAVKAFSKKYAERLQLVAQESVQETISIAQRVKDDGGSMPVVTGFLRASIQGSTESMPAGPSTNDAKKPYAVGAQAYGEPYAVTLLRWNIAAGETMYVGWTANYARYMEAYYGFVGKAVQKWPQTVKKVTKRVIGAGF